MSTKPLHQQWLERSRSNLERAKAGKLSRHILYEDMCFDCQQSVEKALKALMVYHNISFQWTHNIGSLITTLEENQIDVSDNIKKSASLSVYAVRTRYPGEDDPVTAAEFQEALDSAKEVFAWVDDLIKKQEEPEPPEPADEPESDKESDNK